MQINRKKLAFILIFCFMILLAFIVIYNFYNLKTPGASKEKLEQLKIGIQANTISALILVAKDKEFFKNEGLDISIKKYPSGKLALMGMFNHEVELATVADMPITINSFKRDDYSICNSIAYTDNGAWIIARQDHGILKPADLKGKTIATQQFSAVHFFLSQYLLHNQLLETEVNILFKKAVELPDALVNGEIDAFSMRNPFIQEAKVKLGNKAIELYGPNLYRMTFNLVAHKKFMNNNPQLMLKITRALVKTEDYVKKNKAEAIKSTAYQLGINNINQIIKVWDTFHFEISLEQFLLTTLEDQARWAIQQDVTTKKEIPNYLNYIDARALKKVKPEAVIMYTIEKD